MSQQPPKFGERSLYLLPRSPPAADELRALSRWSEFISRPIRPHVPISRGRLSPRSRCVEVLEDRGVFQQFGTSVAGRQTLSLTECAFLMQKGQLSVENADLREIMGMMGEDLAHFALFSYIRRGGQVARAAEHGKVAVYLSSDFRKNTPVAPLFLVSPVSPCDPVLPVPDTKVAVVDQGRVIRVLTFTRWK